MVDRMEQMAREGKTEDAQRMLERASPDLMENLKTARPGQSRQRNQAQRQMDQQMDRAGQDDARSAGASRQDLPRGPEKARPGAPGPAARTAGPAGAAEPTRAAAAKRASAASRDRASQARAATSRMRWRRVTSEGDEGMEGLGQNQQQLREQPGAAQTPDEGTRHERRAGARRRRGRHGPGRRRARPGRRTARPSASRAVRSMACAAVRRAWPSRCSNRVRATEPSRPMATLRDRASRATGVPNPPSRTTTRSDVPRRRPRRETARSSARAERAARSNSAPAR